MVSAFCLRHRPVIFHVLADKGGACGDFHEDISGLVLFNPFRDSLPEEAAARFLNELRNGECTANPSICKYSLDGHLVSDWHLVNRQDFGNRVLLYYKLTKAGTADARYKFTGEGSI